MTRNEKESKIAEFFSNERQNLLRYLHSKVNALDEMDMEDIIGEIMLNLFNRAGLDQQIENLTAYIYRSVYYKAIDFLRRRNRTVSMETRVSENEKPLSHYLTAADGDVAAQVINSDIGQQITAALDTLAPSQRAVWVATEMDGFSFRELAALWNVPMGTLLARKHRANESLREYLKEFQPGAIEE